jgi:uncharacterized membrane protein YdjX (TVP38/TMEM64 family)
MTILVRAILWVAAAVALAIARLSPAIHHALLVLSGGLTAGHLRTYVASWGVLAPAVSIILMIVMTFLPFPAEPLILANGAVFGPWKGLFVSVAGAVLSGCVAFGLGRRLGRSTAQKFIPAPVIEWVESIVREGGWIGVLALQFLPVLPYSILNFVLGTTELSWPQFTWTLAVSILPSDAILVLLGHEVAEQNSAVYWLLAALALLTVGSISLRHVAAQKWRPVPVTQKLSAGAPHAGVSPGRPSNEGR